MYYPHLRHAGQHRPTGLDGCRDTGEGGSVKGGGADGDQGCSSRPAAPSLGRLTLCQALHCYPDTQYKINCGGTSLALRPGQVPTNAPHLLASFYVKKINP